MGDDPELGALVFSHTFALGELTATMNEYASMPRWRRAKVRKWMDDVILVQRQRWPNALMGVRRTTDGSIVNGRLRRRTTTTGGRRRALRVTRHSMVRVDEVSIDTCGGKFVTDRLVQAGILRGDTLKWLHRIATWEPAPPSKGKLVVEVFELASEV